MQLILKIIAMAIWSCAFSPVAGILTLPAAMAETAQDGSIEELSARAERDTARLVRAARQSKDPALGPESETGKPFWEALKGLNSAVLKMSNGAALQDDSFHQGLAESVRNTAALFAVFALTESEDTNVSKALDDVETVIATLEKSFSKPAVRARQGGDLTPEERKKMDQLRAKQDELDKRLKAIEPKVENNAKAKASIKEIRRHAYRVRDSRYTVGGYVSSLLAFSVIDGLLWGAHWWWGPWGVWVPAFSGDYTGIYDTVVADIAYDWAVDGAFNADIGDLEAEALSDGIDLEALGTELDSLDIDLGGGLSGGELEGLASVSETDLSNEAFGLESYSFSEDVTGGLEGVDVLTGEQIELSTGAALDELGQSVSSIEVEDSLGSAGEIGLDLGTEVGGAGDVGLLGELTVLDGEVGDSLDIGGGMGAAVDIEGGVDGADLGRQMDIGGGLGIDDTLDLGGGADLGDRLDIGSGGGDFGGFDDMGMDDLGGFDDF